MTWTILLSGVAMLYLGVRYRKKIKRDINREREQALRKNLLHKQKVGRQMYRMSHHPGVFGQAPLVPIMP